MAAAIASGKAAMAVPKVRMIVPNSAGMIPPSVMPLRRRLGQKLPAQGGKPFQTTKRMTRTIGMTTTAATRVIRQYGQTVDLLGGS